MIGASPKSRVQGREAVMSSDQLSAVSYQEEATSVEDGDLGLMGYGVRAVCWVHGPIGIGFHGAGVHRVGQQD
jgi:hypothetical protein